MVSENGTKVTSISLWQTMLALLLAPVAWAIAAFLVGAFIGITQRLFTVIRPEIIDFGAAIVGGIAGTFAARVTCDRFAERYSRRAIFVMFAVLTLLGVTFLMFLVPAHWGQITAYAQFAVVLITAYILFWRQCEFADY